jgi:hypothetical protein
VGIDASDTAGMVRSALALDFGRNRSQSWR